MSNKFGTVSKLASGKKIQNRCTEKPFSDVSNMYIYICICT